jgi:hypothetical protein
MHDGLDEQHDRDHQRDRQRALERIDVDQDAADHFRRAEHDLPVDVLPSAGPQALQQLRHADHHQNDAQHRAGGEIG